VAARQAGPRGRRPRLPSADIRIGYARCSHLSQELDSQLDALAKHGIDRDKIFSEKISTRIKVRPAFEQALKTAREIKAHAPHCRGILTVFEMKRLGRDAAELTALSDHLTEHGLVLEMLAGPLPGLYDPAPFSRSIEVWTLLEEDQERLRNKSGANRLGFELLLKFFEVEARFPEDAGEIPVSAVSYVAQQVRVPAKEWAAYDWSGRRSSGTGWRSGARSASMSAPRTTRPSSPSGWRSSCAGWG
jgi:hypothetical protein